MRVFSFTSKQQTRQKGLQNILRSDCSKRLLLLLARDQKRLRNSGLLLTAPERSKNEGERIVDRKNNPVNSVALVRLSMIVGVVAVPQQQS